LAALTNNTITDLDTMAEDLERVRERGYAFDHEEVSIGLCCVAAPIYSSRGEVVAAISFSVPSYRFRPRESSYTTAVLDAARHISGNAGAGLEESPDYEMEEV